MASSTYKLQSNGLFFMPGMLRFWRHMATYDFPMAFWQMAVGFPELPACLIHDLLHGRIKETLTGKKKDCVQFTWNGPLGDTKDYTLDRSKPDFDEDKADLQLQD